MEPLTLSAIGAVALTKGIDFLYNQAAELLKRRRERKAAKEGSHDEDQEPIEIEDPGVLKGRLGPAVIDFQAVERLADDLEALCERLASYRSGGTKDVDPEDEELLAAADGLRRALEAVYQQRITFKGEERDASGPVLVGRVDVEEVAGYVAGVRARLVEGQAHIEGEIKGRRVEKDAQAVAVDVDTVKG